MTAAVPIALFGWIPAVLILFALLPPRRAVIASFLIAWLFLPMAGYHFEGLPNYTKATATSYGVLLGIIFFDFTKFSQFRPRLVDLPMALWCLVPFATSISNELGLYDGFATSVDQIITWGLPYFIGRLYFSDLDGLRELAIGIVLGGLIYIPLCLYEVRMSPQLHNMLYGFHPHSFKQQIRYGGYRPMVFMQHGLMVAMWMSSATVLAYWLWWSKSLRGQLLSTAVYFVSALLIVTVLCKSMNALILLVMGVGVLTFARVLKSKLALIAMLTVAPTYIVMRIAEDQHSQTLVGVIDTIDPDRAQSFGARLSYEDILIEHAMQRPMLGWGGWGRNRVFDAEGEDMTVTDGMWIIVFGRYGAVGLAAIVAVLIIPGVMLALRCPPRLWSHPVIAPAAGLAVVSTMYLIDNLPNAMINPIYILAIGGVTGMGFLRRRLLSAILASPAQAPARSYEQHH